MDPTAISSFVQLLSSGGLLVGFVIVIITGVRKSWVFGWVHQAVIDFYKLQIDDMQKRHSEEMAAERQRTQEWREMALHGINTLKDSTVTAGQLVERLPSHSQRT